MADLKSLLPTQTIDISGQVCPHTLVSTKKALGKIESGGVLKVICNHQPAAEETIPRYCEKLGLQFETVKLEGKDCWELFIKKS
ncbi:MAG: sulfurtransferase TusA family protein [Candidatus Mariimomonas ferrooxydans]